MSNVYKNRHLIAKDERVRIPDVEYEYSQPKKPKIMEASDDEGTSVSIPDYELVDELDGAFSRHEIIDETEVPINKKSDQEKPHARIMSKEELMALYEQDLKDLTDSVAQQAYFHALNKKKSELRDCINGVQVLMDEMVSAHKQFIEDYTSELKYMAVDIAEKLIFEKISEDDLILQRLVLQTVSSVKNTEWLNVEISERLVGLVDCIKKELEKPEYNGRAFVFPVTGSDSVCRVVTNEGAVVSTIEVQTDNLRKAFREFDHQEYSG